MKHVAVASAAASHDKTALDSNPITMSKLAVALPPLASCQCEIYELENNDVKDMEKGRARVWRENRKLLFDGGGGRGGSLLSTYLSRGRQLDLVRHSLGKITEP